MHFAAATDATSEEIYGKFHLLILKVEKKFITIHHICVEKQIYTGIWLTIIKTIKKKDESIEEIHI